MGSNLHRKGAKAQRKSRKEMQVTYKMQTDWVGILGVPIIPVLLSYAFPLRLGAFAVNEFKSSGN